MTISIEINMYAMFMFTMFIMVSCNFMVALGIDIFMVLMNLLVTMGINVFTVLVVTMRIGAMFFNMTISIEINMLFNFMMAMSIYMFGDFMMTMDINMFAVRMDFFVAIRINGFSMFMVTVGVY